MDSIKSIAIIGTGISGLTAAHLLHKKNYHVTLFEANNYVGGHTNTISFDKNDQNYSIDTGFIVFNEKTYPNFIKLLNILGVEKQKSNMSFSFSSNKYNLEYCGDTINSLFSQRKNIANPKFYRLLFDIYQFNQKAKKYIQDNNCDISLADFINSQKYGEYFYECYVNPLASAIWSTPAIDVGKMPAKFILDFYDNHGLLDVINRPQWYVIKNGSREYVKKIIKPFSNKIFLDDKVLSVKRSTDCITINTKNGSASFDAVVIACHSNEAIRLLDHPSEIEREILSSIKYTINTAVLHTDINALPKRKSAWGSWNYMQTDHNKPSLTYYMNKLQSIKSADNFCVSINSEKINELKIIKTILYEHPLYTKESVAAKQKHELINNKNRTFYVGAYWGNGFHEDGVLSSINALSSLGVTL